MAGGFTIKESNISLFRNFLIKNYKKLQLDTSKNSNLYLDSLIAPSALNLEFYTDVEKLGPWGSGNSQPKFVIENLNVINSNIVGEKHINSILSGMDGTVIKSIAFNAKDSPIEPFLNKKNKKKINIAGKINLNEWKGKKSIQFVIEDLALN